MVKWFAIALVLAIVIYYADKIINNDERSFGKSFLGAAGALLIFMLYLLHKDEIDRLFKAIVSWRMYGPYPH
jgi:hypothetical protein